MLFFQASYVWYQIVGSSSSNKCSPLPMHFSSISCIWLSFLFTSLLIHNVWNISNLFWRNNTYMFSGIEIFMKYFLFFSLWFSGVSCHISLSFVLLSCKIHLKALGEVKKLSILCHLLHHVRPFILVMLYCISCAL